MGPGLAVLDQLHWTAAQMPDAELPDSVHFAELTRDCRQSIGGCVSGRKRTLSRPSINPKELRRIEEQEQQAQSVRVPRGGESEQREKESQGPRAARLADPVTLRRAAVHRCALGVGMSAAN